MTKAEKLKIVTTSYDSIYYSSTIAGNASFGFYALRNIDVFNEIIIDGTAFQAVYQTAVSLYNDDIDCPHDDLALSDSGSTHKLLIKINELYESDFKDFEYIETFLADVKEIYSAIDTVEKLRQVYHALNDNLPELVCFEDEKWETLEQLQKNRSDEQETYEY